METLTLAGTIKALHSKKIPLFSLNELGTIFAIENRQTLYKKIQRLEKMGIFEKLIKGKYLFSLGSTNDFTIANFLLSPSYISLESALSFYGIITGFPYQITSVTIRKSKLLSLKQKEFAYSHILADLYWGWEKKEDFLIAKPEKALLDYIYFGLKGLRSLDLEEIDRGGIDRNLFFSFAERFNNRQILKIIARLKI